MLSFAPQNKMMKKIILSIVFTTILFSLTQTRPSLAAECSINPVGAPFDSMKQIVEFNVKIVGYTGPFTANVGGDNRNLESIGNDTYNVKLQGASYGTMPGGHTIKVYDGGKGERCQQDYTVNVGQCQIQITGWSDNQVPQIEYSTNPANLHFSVTKPVGLPGTAIFHLYQVRKGSQVVQQPRIQTGNSEGDVENIGKLIPDDNAPYTIHSEIKNIVGLGSFWPSKGALFATCDRDFYFLEPGTKAKVVPIQSKASTAGCDKCGKCTDQSGNITKPPDYDKCALCFEKGTDANYGPGSWSALGCIPTDPQKFIQWLLNNAINIVGGLAFLMILFGSFKVATSSGSPEALTEGKEIIFAALAGLLFIVFSVILLKIIGADILQIPGFQ